MTAITEGYQILLTIPIFRISYRPGFLDVVNVEFFIEFPQVGVLRQATILTLVRRLFADILFFLLCPPVSIWIWTRLVWTFIYWIFGFQSYPLRATDRIAEMVRLSLRYPRWDFFRLPAFITVHFYPSDVQRMVVSDTVFGVIFAMTDGVAEIIHIRIVSSRDNVLRLPTPLALNWYPSFVAGIILTCTVLRLPFVSVVVTAKEVIVSLIIMIRYTFLLTTPRACYLYSRQ